MKAQEKLRSLILPGAGTLRVSRPSGTRRRFVEARTTVQETTPQQKPMSVPSWQEQKVHHHPCKGPRANHGSSLSCLTCTFAADIDCFHCAGRRPRGWRLVIHFGIEVLLTVAVQRKNQMPQEPVRSDSRPEWKQWIARKHRLCVLNTCYTQTFNK